jgi:alanyl-tRNA synthetase
MRALAQSFTALPKAIFTGVVEQPPSVLLAVSADAGLDAGERVKAAVAEFGGRGGGTPRMAQGSVPDPAVLEDALKRLL